MSKRLRELITSDIDLRFRDISEAVFVDCGALTAEETRQLRTHLRGGGIGMRVVKNTLVRRVFGGRGIDFPPAAFSGPTAVLHGTTDAIQASKLTAEWRKKSGKSVKFKAGLLAGKPLDAAATEKLVKMPGVQEIRQMTVSAIAGPLTGMVGVLASTLSALPLVVQAIVDQKNKGEGA